MRERNGMTDFQPFRLFLVGNWNQNEYRKIGIEWWRRIVSMSNTKYFGTTLTDGKSSSGEAAMQRGVRLMRKRLIRVVVVRLDLEFGMRIVK